MALRPQKTRRNCTSKACQKWKYMEHRCKLYAFRQCNIQEMMPKEFTKTPLTPDIKRWEIECLRCVVVAGFCGARWVCSSVHKKSKVSAWCRKGNGPDDYSVAISCDDWDNTVVFLTAVGSWRRAETRCSFIAVGSWRRAKTRCWAKQKDALAPTCIPFAPCRIDTWPPLQHPRSHAASSRKSST